MTLRIAKNEWKWQNPRSSADFPDSKAMKKICVLMIALLWVSQLFPVDSPNSRPRTAALSIDWGDVKPFREASSIGSVEVYDAVFLDGDRVALAALFSSLPDNNAGKNFRDTIRRTAAVAVLNATSGRLEAFRTWKGITGQPAFEYKLEIHPTAAGNLLIGVGDTLYLVSPNLQDVATRPLSQDRVERSGYSYLNMWSLRTSPTGNTAVLVKHSSKQEIEDHWFDPGTLLDYAVTAAPNYSVVQLLEDRLVFNQNDSEKIWIHIRGEAPRQLCPTCNGTVLATFGKENVFFSTNSGSSYVIADSNGHKLYEKNVGGRGTYIQKAVGAASNTIAFEYGGTTGLSNKAIVSVLNLNSIQQLRITDINTHPNVLGTEGVQFRTARIAISRSGHKVLVLGADSLQIFAVD
jgi:hypothetical protein